ncbi:hypothetical protein OROMI_017435 [Orobanche minor]
MSGGGATWVSVPNNVRKLIQELKRSTVSNHSDEFLHTTLKDSDMDLKEAGRRVKMVHDIKAIAGRKHSDEFVYTTLKDCGMDSNEAGGRLKVIHDVKEIAGKHSVEDIYTMLKECNMDPNEAVQRLLYIDTFQEAKKKKQDRRKSVNGNTYGDYGQRQGSNQWRGIQSCWKEQQVVSRVSKPTIQLQSVKIPNVLANCKVVHWLHPISMRVTFLSLHLYLNYLPLNQLYLNYPQTVVVSSKKTCAIGSIQCEIVKRSSSTKSSPKLPAVIKPSEVSEKTRIPKPDVVEKIQKPVSLPKPDSRPIQEQSHEPVKEVVEKVAVINTNSIPEEKPEAGKPEVTHQQTVILPNNLHVPEDFKKHFTFGSLNAALNDRKSCQQKDESVPVPEEACLKDDTSSSDPGVKLVPEEVCDTEAAVKHEVEMKMPPPLQYPVFQRDYGFSYMPHPHFVHPDSGSSVTASGLSQGQSQSQSESPATEGGITMSPPAFPYYKQAYANYMPYMNPYVPHLYHHLPQFPLPSTGLKFPPPPQFKQDNCTPSPSPSLEAETSVSDEEVESPPINIVNNDKQIEDQSLDKAQPQKVKVEEESEKEAPAIKPSSSKDEGELVDSVSKPANGKSKKPIFGAPSQVFEASTESSFGLKGSSGSFSSGPLFSTSACGVQSSSGVQNLIDTTVQDRISELPGDLIASILDQLPIEFAVRTSTLSKRWRYCWREKKKLVFDKQFFKRFSSEKMLSVITGMLLQHQAPISKFDLYRSPGWSDEVFQQKIRHWVSILSRNGVTGIVIRNSYKAFKTPRHIFSCPTLIELDLENCVFKLPTDLEQVFPQLEFLHLGIVDFGDDVSETDICLPQLKQLILSFGTNLSNCKIKAPKLNTLHIYCCVGTWLVRLLENSPCITCFYLSVDGATKQVEGTLLPMILSQLPVIEEFYVSTSFLKVLTAANIPESLPFRFASLKRLTLAAFDLALLHNLKGMLLLLRNSPNLESLILRGVEFVVDADEEAAASILEDLSCLHLDRLENVQIESVKGFKLEMLFIEIILAISPSLKKLTIMTSHRLTDAQKRQEIANAVLLFPTRADADISFP